MNGAGSLVDGLSEQGMGGPGGRDGGGTGGAIKPDDRVEVDDAAPLVSATLAKETRTWAANALLVSPTWRARVRRKVIVKRRHSSGAQALNSTAPV